MGWKDKVARFMRGRYGVDSFSRFLLGVALACLLISTFLQGALRAVVYWLSVFALIYCYYRAFSRNYAKRYEENRRFLDRTAGIRSFFARQKSLMAQRKTHHIYTCPGCKQKIRVPRGRGKIEISCPKCQTKFVKRS